MNASPLGRIIYAMAISFVVSALLGAFVTEGGFAYGVFVLLTTLAAGVLCYVVILVEAFLKGVVGGFMSSMRDQRLITDQSQSSRSFDPRGR